MRGRAARAEDGQRRIRIQARMRHSRWDKAWTHLDLVLFDISREPAEQYLASDLGV